MQKRERREKEGNSSGNWKKYEEIYDFFVLIVHNILDNSHLLKPVYLGFWITQIKKINKGMFYTIKNIFYWFFGINNTKNEKMLF